MACTVSGLQEGINIDRPTLSLGTLPQKEEYAITEKWDFLNTSLTSNRAIIQEKKVLNKHALNHSWITWKKSQILPSI